ncbi:pyroglutamyl-peptidase I [Rhodoligotrophos defluvii]|uniref:pyroglutamyl-peptidase I n=1 Tax=Rhodoligotrophos defluvii TaxID=2561934 RepID=UPI0010C96F03|nr:pyroglutamyl-peptidase I [Rhodoligotrophos defluvii]
MGQEAPKRGDGPPRILVTGFPPFPTAPVNPTEHLVEMLKTRHAGLEADIHAAVIPCAYGEAPDVLARLGRDIQPDIVLCFGLSRKATAFTLERIARNRCGEALADTAGQVFAEGTIRAGAAEILPSGLPLDAIRAALEAEGIPAKFSDDAGSYLCNFVFYLIIGGYIPSLAPAMAGFIHVPAFETPLADTALLFSKEILWRGACCCLRTVTDCWRNQAHLVTSTEKVHI